ncbi:MAG: TetR family transcriptional regulator [Colwellia sp.]|nr:TetR family transcriptional regulator [Colwellia sp.]
MSTIEKSTKVKHGSKGEKTKQHILNTTIAVLATQGIKGTTHRAIAKEANIQLSLTTYYFKDIQELIHQAFQLNSAQTIALASITWQNAFNILDNISIQDLEIAKVKQQLCDDFSTMASEYIFQKIINQANSLAVEQLLFTEIQITPELRTLAQQHKSALILPFLRLCQHFNKQDPQIDADIMLTILTQLEYRHLAVPINEINKEELYLVTRRVIAWVIGVKP